MFIRFYKNNNETLEYYITSIKVFNELITYYDRFEYLHHIE